VKVFGWLLHLNRLNTLANLKHKYTIDFASCPRCPRQDKDLQHLFFLYPASRQLGQRIGINPQSTPLSPVWKTTLHRGRPREEMNRCPPVDHTQFFMKSGGVTHYRNMQYTKKMGLDHVSSDTCWLNIGSPLLPHVLTSLVWNSICLLILWKIWDARNAIVFRHIDQNTTTTIRNILSDLTLYSFRFKKTDQRVVVDLCRDHFSLYIL
jgi:hypothetical protein